MGSAPSLGTEENSAGHVSGLALRSLRHFFTLAGRGVLRMPKERLGMVIHVEGRGAYTVFRETVNTQSLPEVPVIMVVGFRLKGIGSNPVFHYIFQRVCIITTPFWSGLPGFCIKLWMVDPATMDYAGIYEWKGKENAQVYMNALIPVLHIFSVKRTVWHWSCQSEKLETRLFDTTLPDKVVLRADP